MPAKSLIEQDAELMNRVASGDQTACRVLAGAHLDSIYRMALRILGDTGHAEDIAQEAFLKLWKAAGGWEAKAQVKTWLHRVTHNLCIDRLRKENRYSTSEVPDIADPTKGPWTAREDQQMKDQITHALQELPPRQRIAVTLVHLEECGNKEAAEIMEISVEALESLLSRGRRKLRALLGPARELLGREAG
ncbi:RNA polymerase sigma factor [Sneathiella sp.]|jgi:RNA polymerase sigma-70 factor (ECF subfamily)|uniref:RNA polymerase sigma factor n=1 Tax=Sneathiella sp. TaxID=1964365 RepID=UPI0039E58D50